MRRRPTRLHRMGTIPSTAFNFLTQRDLAADPNGVLATPSCDRRGVERTYKCAGVLRRVWRSAAGLQSHWSRLLHADRSRSPRRANTGAGRIITLSRKTVLAFDDIMFMST